MFVNDDEFIASLPTGTKDSITAELGEKIHKLVDFVHVTITARTPVWQGTTLRNYVWSMDTPYSGGMMPAVGTGDPGPTNSMPLGIEPRRDENQAEADATLAALTYADPFHAYILNNTSTAVEGLEQGILPYSPLQQRSPEGMFALTFAEAVERLESGVL